MIKIAVILLNYNGKADTLACLSSLEKQTYRHFDIILVDNGSTDDSVQAFRLLTNKHITLIENGDNLGFAEGNNVGIRFALEKKVDACFLLNNDTEIEPTCLEKLAIFHTSHPNAILGACLLQFHNRDKIDHLGGFWNPKKANFDLIAAGEYFDQKRYGEPLICDFVCGAAFFVPTAIFTTIGLLEPSFFLIWEESDFCMRAKKQGFPSIYCPDAIVYHKVSSSFTGGKPHTKYYWWRNRLLFIKRNLPAKKYRMLMRTIIAKEIIHIAKLYCIKSLPIKCMEFFGKTIKKETTAKVKSYKASLIGILHFFQNRFGKAPSWLTKK